VTARLLGWGLLTGWALGLGLALPLAFLREALDWERAR